MEFYAEIIQNSRFTICKIAPKVGLGVSIPIYRICIAIQYATTETKCQRGRIQETNLLAVLDSGAHHHHVARPTVQQLAVPRENLEQEIKIQFLFPKSKF